MGTGHKKLSRKTMIPGQPTSALVPFTHPCPGKSVTKFTFLYPRQKRTNNQEYLDNVKKKWENWTVHKNLEKVGNFRKN